MGGPANMGHKAATLQQTKDRQCFLMVFVKIEAALIAMGSFPPGAEKQKVV